ncbi:MAG: hypothetical protein DDT20_00877 [Firmicutes bacterium]|nr:hypothetical protein [Bacillota bacterium]MBT9176557.1 hypothetical protein [Bacillota bacterium]
MESTKNWIEINGIRVAEPSSTNIRIFRSSPRRDAYGRMPVEKNTKREVTLEYESISDSDLEAIMTQLNSGIYHTIRHPDPQTGGSRVTEVYVDNIHMGTRYVAGGVRRWHDVSIDLVEHIKDYATGQEGRE